MKRRAFTLIELLVVIAIAGILAAISVPAIKEFGRSTAERAATRQLLDDVARARQLAIVNRTTVYMAFMPPFNNPSAILNSLPPADRQRVSALLGSQMRAYALISLRTIGDQPGQSRPQYLSDWTELPQGWFFATNKFVGTAVYPRVFPQRAAPDLEVAPFTNGFALPFPSAQGLWLPLPHIAFNHLGQLESGRDAHIPLVRGAVDVPRDAGGDPLPLNLATHVQENPPGNNFDTFRLVSIDWLTGRARLLERELE
jgi:prepilin-type N-terminal cleavage/methylation domain-containing protein